MIKHSASTYRLVLIAMREGFAGGFGQQDPRQFWAQLIRELKESDRHPITEGGEEYP